MSSFDSATADVHVVLPDGREVLAGTVTDIPGPQAASHRLSFSYAPSFLADPLGYDLSPDMPRMSGPLRSWEGRAELGAISDAMPDQWGKRIIRAGTTARTRFDYLVHVNDETRHGALRFKADGDYVGRRTHPVQSVHDLDAIVRAATAFEDGTESDDDLRILLHAGTSAGGARPKAVIQHRQALWIAKFARETEYSDPMAWEAVCLELARRAGINIPQFELRRIGRGRSILLTERFDRVEGRRVGYVSAHSLTLKQDDYPSSYASIAETISTSGATARDDLHELFRRVALNLLVGNVDDHFRNHGFLRLSTGWALSPVFDLEPNRRPDSVEATPIVEGGEREGRDIRELRDAHDVFDLTRGAAAQIIRQVADASSGWRKVAVAHGISPEAAGGMQHAFDGPNRERANQISTAAESGRDPKRTRAQTRRGQLGLPGNGGRFAAAPRPDGEVSL